MLVAGSKATNNPPLADLSPGIRNGCGIARACDRGSGRGEPFCRGDRSRLRECAGYRKRRVRQEKFLVRRKAAGACRRSWLPWPPFGRPGGNALDRKSVVEAKRG